MGDISKHFNRSEFACNCGCGFDTVDAELIKILEQVREKFGPVQITSGCRCSSWNFQCGGTKKSQHLLGRAADLKVRGVEPRDVAEFVESIMPGGGIGKYESFTHIDTRSGKARW